MFSQCSAVGGPRYQRMALVVLLTSFAGCGGPYDATLSGVVTLDGQPVPRGTVSFAPTTGGPIAYSRIASDGSYAVQTGRDRGLPSGEYLVTVIANELPDASKLAPGVPPPDGEPITPEWYRSTKTSGLKTTVLRGKNTYNLELTSRPPGGWKPGG